MPQRGLSGIKGLIADGRHGISAQGRDGDESFCSMGTFSRGLRTYDKWSRDILIHPSQQAGRRSSILRRTMATEATVPGLITSIDQTSASDSVWNPRTNSLRLTHQIPCLKCTGQLTFQPLVTTVPVTIHAFPTLEPRSLEHWSVNHLYLPLRRDLLHLAIVYEGDKTRQGTAHAKTRWEVHGSGRKLYRQKGTGKARAGDKKSPIRRGGGKSFGPHARDFSTKLNRKVYDVAWRTALSYRYRKGELIVCADGVDLPLPRDYTDLVEAGFLGQQLMDSYRAKAVGQILDAHSWGRRFGRTTFVTMDKRQDLWDSLAQTGEQEARALELEDVDVKDLLETGRIVIERSALREMILAHQSDLVSNIFINGRSNLGPPVGEVVIE
jgi:large subunit ribosomal protein L4